jgi:8-oxo-dGTP pyrophosphatase MutT (NUDIX family)
MKGNDTIVICTRGNLVQDGSVTNDDVAARVRSDVAARQPVDERERAAIDQFLDAFARLNEPFSQESSPIHVTGSGLVIGSRGVVLLKHKRLGLWLQPGGHIDPRETPWAAALRESREETGLEVRFDGPLDEFGVPELLHVDVHSGGRGHTHLDLRYLIDGGSADPDPPEGESQDVDWFEWDAAIDRADPGLKGILTFLQTPRNLAPTPR